MYPTIFTLALQDLGGNTKRGGAFVVQGVGGGAIFPPIEGAIADKASTRIGQIVPTLGYAYLIIYAFSLAKAPTPPTDDLESK
jgi:FHS family L-fucose permease-like MFS transporter